MLAKNPNIGIHQQIRAGRWLATAIVTLFALLLGAPAQAELGGNPDLYEINPDPSTPWTEFVEMESGLDPSQDEPVGQYITLPAWAIDDAPIPQQEKDILIADYAAEGIDYRQSEEILVIDVVTAAMTEEEALAAGLAPSAMTKSGYSCGSWWDHGYQDTHTFDRSRTFNESYGGSEDSFEGGLQGTIAFAATLDFDILAQVRISPWYAACVPYKVRLKHAKANGNATITADLEADGEFEKTFSWAKERTIYDNQLFAIDFSIGPFPVHLPVSLAFAIGIETEAKIAGEAHAEAHAEATGTISIDCTSDDCSSSSNLAWDYDVPSPTVDVNIDAKAQLYARAQLDIALYHRSVLMAGVKAKGGVEAQLWGYLGNQCGDGDGDGSNEYVQGLTADFYAFYDIDAILDSEFFDEKKWDLLGNRYHLWWLDLLAGNSTALTPMIVGPASVESGETVTYEMRTRPCFPYEEEVWIAWDTSNGYDNFRGMAQVTPPDGKESASGQLQIGSRTMTAALGYDAEGRDFSAYSQSRSITATLPAADRAADDEHFGQSSTAGDFDCDGLADVAIGVPGEDAYTRTDSGMVHVIFGRGAGMPNNSAAELLLFTDGPLESSVTNAEFGFAVAAGDFDGDGCDDLAVGMPGRSSDAGSAKVFYGHPEGDLMARTTHLNRNLDGMPGDRNPLDRFGESLATGDINGDGFAELAIAVPGDGFGSPVYGTTIVLYGSASGIFQDDAPIAPQNWNQNTAGVPDYRENGDGYGLNAAIADFDGDGYGDLALGYPHEDVQINADGAVILVPGTANGLVGTGSYLFQQSSAGGSSQEERDYFGNKLASGDFDGDGYADLVVAAAGEDWGTTPNAGSVHILWGNVDGPGNGSNRYLISSQWANLETDAWFGNAIATGDVNGDGFDDLVIGATNVVVNGVGGAGRVYVAYSDGDRTFTRPTDATGMIDRATPYVDGAPQANAGFGSSLACADYNGDGIDDLVATAMWDTVHGHAEAGSATSIKGYASGLFPTSTSYLLSQSN